MSATINIPGVIDMGCRSHFDPGNFNPGTVLETAPTSVQQCANACAARSFTRLTVSSLACTCYMEVNIVSVPQNIAECNNLCVDGPCGTRDFLNRFSFYDITELRDNVQASITASISASIAAERSRTESIRSMSSSLAAASSLSSGKIETSTTTSLNTATSSATSTLTAVPANAPPRPTSLTPDVLNPNGQSQSSTQDPPFILQTGGILMMVALAILVAIGGFIAARYYRRRNGKGKNGLPVFTVLPKRPSTDSVSMQPSSTYGSTLGRSGTAMGTLTRPGGAGNLTPTGGGTMERTGSSPRPGSNANVSFASSTDGLAGGISMDRSGTGSLPTKKEDLVHQMFGLSSFTEESRHDAGDPLGVDKARLQR
ncbi:hypothetical protein HDU67_003195 [Dinochytrium kinnereticum]|nr:hypothetical protein HDU67_003195 [Dinochytrium kinnereticum]